MAQERLHAWKPPRGLHAWRLHAWRPRGRPRTSPCPLLPCPLQRCWGLSSQAGGAWPRQPQTPGGWTCSRPARARGRPSRRTPSWAYPILYPRGRAASRMGPVKGKGKEKVKGHRYVLRRPACPDALLHLRRHLRLPGQGRAQRGPGLRIASDRHAAAQRSSERCGSRRMRMPAASPSSSRRPSQASVVRAPPCFPQMRQQRRRQMPSGLTRMCQCHRRRRSPSSRPHRQRWQAARPPSMPLGQGSVRPAAARPPREGPIGDPSGFHAGPADSISHLAPAPAQPLPLGIGQFYHTLRGGRD